MAAALAIDDCKRWCKVQFGMSTFRLQESGYPYLRDPGFQFLPGAWNLGIMALLSTDPFPPTGGKPLAWDPIAQKERWSVPYASMNNGGVLSTAGDLVF